MKSKMKLLGLGVLSVMAIAALAASASANSGGHIVSEIAHTTLVGTESEQHRVHITGDFGSGEIGCDTAIYHGTTLNVTHDYFELTPTYEDCSTTGSSSVSITHNGCRYRFTIAPGGTTGTLDIAFCSGAMEIHHPNCTITVLPQFNLSGVHYTTTTENNKHALTVHVNVKFNTQYHGGICIFLGTPHTGEMKGSITLRGTDTEGNRVGITTT